MAEGFEVLADTIAFVPGKAILRILGIERDHEPVAGNFGHDAGRGDAQAEGVTTDQGAVRHGEAAHGESVDQGVVGLGGEGTHRARHGEVGGAENVVAIDFFDRGQTGGPGHAGVGGEDCKNFFTAGGGDFFRVGQAVESKVRRKDDGGGHDRPGQRSAPGFIDSSNQKKPAGTQGVLAGEIAGHGAARKGSGRRFGGDAGFFFDRGGRLAFAVAKVVEFGPADRTFLFHFDFGNARGMQR